MFRGTVIAQAIGILGSLYLAKTYGTDAYGVFGVFISITSIFSIINTLQLEKNIVTSKVISNSKNWFNFLTLIIPIIATILLGILYVFNKSNILNNITNDIVIYSFLGGLLVSYFTINESLFLFRKKFKLLSNSKIIITLINVVLQAILYSKYQLYGLIYGYIISQGLVVIYFYINNSKFFSKISFDAIKIQLKDNNSIIKYLLPGNTINGFAIHLMPILLLAFFNQAQAGVYFFTTKLLTAPLFLISSSVSQVYFKKASELYHTNKPEILQITKKLIKGNLILMFIILLLINTIGMYLLEWYLDTDWNNLRSFTLILSFLILARTSFNPISSLIVVLNKNHISLLFNVYLLLINLIAIYIGFLYQDISISIIILSAFGGLGYLVLLLYFLNVLKKLKNA
ncbi:MAG: hypothetical protein JXQ93_06750 [Flavobacteriaceae bacterium]